MTTLPPAKRKFHVKKTHARPLGAGKLARAREMRKRGIHLQLIEAWRPFPTHLEAKRTETMTTVSDAFPSNFLKAADLANRTVKVKIDKVVFEEIGQNKDKKPVIYFADVKKGLVLNKTNAEQIGSVHGQELEGWTGREIELFSQMVPFNGQNVAAIRVRAVAEAVVAGAADPNDPLGI